MLLGENFLSDILNVDYGVNNFYLPSLALGYTKLWLYSDSHGMAVSQKGVRRVRVSTK